MSLAAIEQLLKQRMGLHSATVGSGTVAQAVEHRMLACELSDPDDYLQIVSHSTTELDALIDTVVIPETWFFRDQNPFDAFSNWVSHHWLPRNSLKPLRILSIPCSTGEEPYTLAMCLADLDLPAGAAQIDAVDISQQNIDRAMAASYGSNSFRSRNLGFRDRHFVAEGTRYRLKEAIRKRVNFARANILDAAFLQQRQPYHVIFCRNLLIYFDRPTQNQVIERLEQLLAPDGVLFLGHSETSLLLERDFESLSHPRCFGFQRQPNRKQSAGADTAQRRPKAPPRPAPAKHRDDDTTPRPFADISPDFPPGQETPGHVPAAGIDGDADTLLRTAFRLADQGHLDEAAQHCETLLRQQQYQAEAHYLLGLIREAAGSLEDAAQMFRKTIYLDPDHHEALAHLGVICEQQGDAVSAQRFQQRARRAQQRRSVGEKQQ